MSERDGMLVAIIVLILLSLIGWGLWGRKCTQFNDLQASLNQVKIVEEEINPRTNQDVWDEIHVLGGYDASSAVQLSRIADVLEDIDVTLKEMRNETRNTD